MKEITTIRFNIPESLEFPEEYRGGHVEVAVYPAPGVMPSVIERDGGLERLEKWAVSNILLGFIEGDYSENDLRQDFIQIRAVRQDGQIVLDTFG